MHRAEPHISHITKSGQDALWTTYALCVLTTLFIAILTTRLHIKHRALHLIALVIAGVAALSYYAMATQSGVSYVSKGLNTIDGEERLVLRQVFWARYIDWLITAPLLYFACSLIAGIPWVDVVPLMLCIFASILTTTIGALLHGLEKARWGWYAHTCFFALLVLFVLFGKGRQCAKQQHAHHCRLYTAIAVFTVFLALIFIGSFILCEGTGILTVNTEVILYAVFDILTHVLLPIWFVIGYKFDEEEAHVACFSDAWTKVRGSGDAIRLPRGDD